MKKKLSVAIVLILLLAVSLTTFVGCDDMFTRNEERDNTQVVATVDYHGLSANIYKYELISTFDAYSYMYVNYYGMSKKEAANYILRSLAQQKLLTLYAREKVTELSPEIESIPADVKDLLSRSEINKAVEDTNESLFNQLKSRVEDAINEDSYNNEESGSNTGDDDDDDEDVEITEARTVRFNSNGGSDVERQRIQTGTKAKKPTDPTKEGYVFYGWYEDAGCNDVDFVAGKFETGEDGKTEYVSYEFDFSTKIDENKTLYARWIETAEARTEMPEPEEEEDKDDKDYDPDDDSETIVIAPYFFTDEYKATLAEKFADEDFVEKIEADSDKTLEDYINDCLADLFKDYKASLYKKTDEECYNYFLAQQLDSVLVTKMQRLINKDVKVTEEEVKAEFDAVVNKNKQSFTGSNGESAYESALTSTLNSTYYHPSLTDATGSYGFVINILLKLDDESLNKLTEMCKNDPSALGAEKAKIMRNRFISEMQIKVSNPSYKSSEKVEDADGKEIELRDPMTDPRNPYNSAGGSGKTKDTKFEAEDGNDYENLVKFGYNDKDEKFEITYGATEHAAMPYLEQKVYAFDKDGEVGIIHQIHESLNSVMSYTEEGAEHKLTKEQSVYWLREVATKWLYLVGDDSGALSDSSNNGGLGYLVSPEGKDSSFLSDFTDYARALIAQGTGAYSVSGESASDLFVGTGSPDGTLNGNGKTYVVADSFIGNGTTNFDNAYAGVFVLLNSYTVWEPDKYDYEEGDDNDGHTLPSGYNMTVGKDEDDIKSIYATIEETMLEAKKTLVYNLDVNTMGVEQMESAITYYEKAYKSLWK